MDLQLYGIALLAMNLVANLTWVGVGALGVWRMRALPGPGLLLLAAGIVGFLEGLVVPVASMVVTNLLMNQAGTSEWVWIQVGVIGVSHLLGLIPWILLLGGLWRTLAAVAPRPGDAPGS